MKTTTRWTCALLMLAGPSLAPAALKVPSPDRLPADTWVLINWHGVANATRVRDTNPVMQLWNDPQFAAAREQIATRIVGAVGKGWSQDETRAALTAGMSTLENPFVIGIVGDPLAPGKGAEHVYVVYNRQGKEAEWSRWHSQVESRADTEVSTFTFRGLQVHKLVAAPMPKPASAPDPAAPVGSLPQPKISTSFSASLGDYELYSDDQALLESLITRLLDGSRSGDSLQKNAVYQRAQRFRAKGPLLEVFVKVPDLFNGPSAAKLQGQARALLRALHFERVQGLWLSVGMQRKRTQIRAALLGDTSPGSVLDLIGDNVKDFQTAAAAPADSSFGAVRLNLPALYTTIMNALKADLKPDQGVAIDMMLNGAIIAQTGMRLQAILAMISGEIGAVTTGQEKLDGASLPALLMIPAKGEQVLLLLRTVASSLLANEQQISGATVVQFRAVPRPPGEVAADEQQEKVPVLPFFVAVSPDMFVISPDRSRLVEVLAHDASHASAPAGSLAADPGFRAARKSFPKELNSISYTDFSHVRWGAYIQALHEKIARQRQAILNQAEVVERGGKAAPDPGRAAQLREQAEEVGGVEQIIAELLPLAARHLKSAAGGGWKAGDGEFFDSFVD